MFPEAKQNSLFPVGPVIKCFVIPPNSEIEEIVYGCYLTTLLKILKAFVQILLFAEVFLRFHCIVDGLVSRLRVFVPKKKLLNFFFIFFLKHLVAMTAKKLFSLRGLAQKSCESEVQVVVSLGSW